MGGIKLGEKYSDNVQVAVLIFGVFFCIQFLIKWLLCEENVFSLE